MIVRKPISQSAGFLLMTSPLCHPNFEVFPLDQIADVGVSLSRKLKLICRKIIFDYSNPSEKHIGLRERHRQTGGRTDGQTDGRRTDRGHTVT